jgi:hypothetical protein
MWIDSDILCGGGVRLVRGVSYVVRTAFRRRQATPDGQTDTVQTNRTLSVVNPSAVHCPLARNGAQIDGQTGK